MDESEEKGNTLERTFTYYFNNCETYEDLTGERVKITMFINALYRYYMITDLQKEKYLKFIDQLFEKRWKSISERKKSVEQR